MFFINPTVVLTSLAHFEERLLKNDPGGLHDQVRHSRADPEKRIEKARLQYQVCSIVHDVAMPPLLSDSSSQHY